MRKGTKSNFILARPATETAYQVVQAAKEQGIDIQERYVHNIRSAHGIRTRRRGRRPAAMNRRVWAGNTAAPSADIERECARLIGELGLSRSRDILADVERQIVG